MSAGGVRLFAGTGPALPSPARGRARCAALCLCRAAGPRAARHRLRRRVRPAPRSCSAAGRRPSTVGLFAPREARLAAPPSSECRLVSVRSRERRPRVCSCSVRGRLRCEAGPASAVALRRYEAAERLTEEATAGGELAGYSLYDANIIAFGSHNSVNDTYTQQ